MSRTSTLRHCQQDYQCAVAQADKARAKFRAAVRRELDDGRTLDDIGQELGLTRQRVQQIAASS